MGESFCRHLSSEPHARAFERFVAMALEGDAEFYALASIERALSAYVEARPEQFFSDAPAR